MGGGGKERGQPGRNRLEMQVLVGSLIQNANEI